MEDQHPSDGIMNGLANTFHSFISGDAFKQSIRDAWDRHFGTLAPQQNQTVQDMNKAANDKSVQDANKSFVDEAAAANIRAKTAQRLK